MTALSLVSCLFLIKIYIFWLLCNTLPLDCINSTLFPQASFLSNVQDYSPYKLHFSLCFQTSFTTIYTISELFIFFVFFISRRLQIMVSQFAITSFLIMVMDYGATQKSPIFLYLSCTRQFQKKQKIQILRQRKKTKKLLPR